MIQMPTSPRLLLWRVLSQCAGACWHSLDSIDLPSAKEVDQEGDPIFMLIRQIQTCSRKRQGAMPKPALSHQTQEDCPAVLQFHVELAFQHLQLAEQKILFNDEQQARAHCCQFLSSLLSAAVTTLGEEFTAEEKESILSTGRFLSARLATQLEVRMAVGSGSLPARMIFVLGMHRSGTSALSGMLCKSGFDPPSDLMPAHPDNPLGYWESFGVCVLNDEYLSAQKASWRSPSNLPIGWKDDPKTEIWRRRMLQHVEMVFAGATVPVIKDPRFCILLEGLSPWLESNSIQPYILLPIRDPLEVASSLEEAYKIPLGTGIKLWLHYVLEAEHASRGHPRIGISFHDLIKTPEQCLARCQALVCHQDPDSDKQKGFEHVSADLHRQHRSELNGKISQIASQYSADLDLAEATYDLLCKPDINAPQTIERLDHIRSLWRLLAP